jgi:tRNA threonylcarbamoyladenosine biosynthesis protein TsaE
LEDVGSKTEILNMTDIVVKNGAELVLKTTSAEETLEYGRKLGALLRPGDIVALVGDLGTGKTWLAKGIAFGLDVPDHEYVNSPAFDLVHEYQGRLPVFHMDFYRLDHLANEDYSWIREYLDRSGVCIIEWADKFIDQLTDAYLKVELSQGDGNEERELIISNVGGRFDFLIKALEKR